MSKGTPTTKLPGVLRSLSAAEERTLDANNVPVKIGRQFRRTQVKTEGYNADDHTVELTLTSEQPVERYYGQEILSHKKGAIRNQRLQNGVSLLFNHDPDQLLGRSIGFSAPDGGPLSLKYRFGPSALAQEKEQEVAAGVLGDTSGGYQVHKWDIVEDKQGNRTYTATDWEPLEGSLVTVPADPTVGVGRGIPVEYTLRKLGDDGEVTETRHFRFDPVLSRSVELDDDEDDDEVDEGDRALTAGGNAGEATNQTTTGMPKTGGRDTSSETPTDTTQPTQQRTNVMAEETKDPAKLNEERIAGLRQLNKEYPKEFNERALKAAEALDVPLADARRAVADAIIAGAQRSDVSTIGDGVLESMTEKERKSYSIVRALRYAINQRFNGTFTQDAEAGLELEVSNEIRKQAGKAGVSGLGAGLLMPNNVTVDLSRAASVAQRLGSRGTFVRNLTAGGNAGSTTINTVTETTVIELLRSRVRSLQLGAQLISGVHGLFRIPKQTAAASSNWLAESAGGTESDATLTDISFTPHRLNLIGAYTIELLNQSVLAVEDFIRADQIQVKARSLDYAALAGSGSGNVPLGLLNQSGLPAIISGTTRAANGTVTAGAGGVPLTYVDCNGFESTISTANADEADMGWMFTPKVRGALRSTPKFPGGISDPIWPTVGPRDPGGLDVGPLGYKAGVTTQLPTNFTYNSVNNLHAAIFGYWPSMLMVDWGISELVLDNITQASEGIYQIIENSLHDTNVRHVESFAACTTILPS